MDAEELGRRLRAAREARGLTQQAAADALDVPRTAVTQMEAGNRAVSTLELSRLAELYVIPAAAFLQESTWDEDVLVALYRVAPGLERDPATHREVVRCVSLCREGVALETFLGGSRRSCTPSYETPLLRASWEAVAQGEQTAIQERRRLGIGNAPIADVSELIASQGIWASGVGLPNEMSGMFLRHPSIGFAILVNASHPRGRKRFSYAHEYAHALLDRNHNITVSTTDNSSELVERRANAFAAAFLMPSHGVHDALSGLAKGLPSRQEQTVFDVATGGHIDTHHRLPARSQRINYKDIAMLARHFESKLSGRALPIEEPAPRHAPGVPRSSCPSGLGAPTPSRTQHVRRCRRTRKTTIPGSRTSQRSSPSSHRGLSSRRDLSRSHSRTQQDARHKRGRAPPIGRSYAHGVASLVVATSCTIVVADAVGSHKLPPHQPRRPARWPTSALHVDRSRRTRSVRPVSRSTETTGIRLRRWNSVPDRRHQFGGARSLRLPSRQRSPWCRRMLSNSRSRCTETTSSPSTDRRAIIEARRNDQALRIVTTQDLIVSMIHQRLLTVPEADVIKDEWATKHRFRLKLNSFQDLVA